MPVAQEIDVILNMAVDYAKIRTGRINIQVADLLLCGNAKKWEDCLVTYDEFTLFYFNIARPDGRIDTFALSLKMEDAQKIFDDETERQIDDYRLMAGDFSGKEID